jgi:hypothetical protein
MWILRGKKGSLSEQANIMFEMVWQGMANPQKHPQGPPLIPHKTDATTQ